MINDKLQGNVATSYDVIVNNQIKKGLLLSLSVKKFLKSVNIWQSYKQHFLCLLAVWWLVHKVHKTTMFFASYSPM